MELFDSLFDDECLIWQPQMPVGAAVAEYLVLREAYADVVATLVVPDRQLAEVARHVPAGTTVRASVIISAGAGGLIGLARRNTPSIAIVSAEPALRDFDDLGGNAARVVTAAAELGSEVAIFVELPYAPGWQSAIEPLESAGLCGKIAASQAEPRRSAEQLSILIEADLPFKITSRLTGSSWLALLAAVDALIDGAGIDDAAMIMRSDGNDQTGMSIPSWEEATQSRVRRRVRRVGTDRVRDVIEDCAAAARRPGDS